MCFNKNNKKISFFIVQDNKDSPNFLTVTCKKEDAVDFAYKYLRVKNFDHFKLWCDLRELDPQSDSAWERYFQTCLTIEEKRKYLIRKVTYKMNDLAAILRMFGGCLPIGCSFDTESEYNYLKYKLQSQEATKTLAKTLEEVFTKAKEEMQKEQTGEKTDGE